MKAVRAIAILAACVPAFAQSPTSDWFPADTGNQWIYQRESRTVPARNPTITRWQTIETITGTRDIPEGTVVLRHVEVQGNPPGGWLTTIYGQSHFLLRNGCLYFLNAPYSWDDTAQRLKADYHAQLLAGDVEPEFCFPLTVGKTYGKDAPPGFRPARVAGLVSGKPFDVVIPLFYADETHLWFEKGVGITGMSDRHHGTYDEYHVRLLRFRPARPQSR